MQTILHTCVMCAASFDLENRIFEQRLVNDTDFCPRCFSEILTASYDDDVNYDFEKEKKS